MFLPYFQVAHKYFVDFLSKGNMAVAEEIFDEECEHLDVVWAPTHPSVGPEGMKHYLHDVKTAFPDFFVEINNIAAST